MPLIPLVIAMFPANMEEWARALGMTAMLVPTEGYTLTACHECKGQAWLGPKQREVYETTEGPVALLCYVCVMKVYHNYVVMSLNNPNAARIEPLS